MFAQVLQKLGVSVSQEYKIGQHKITLPAGHQLANYQKRWRCYDQALARIAAQARLKYPELTAIDVGANIGDTAALICSEQNLPVLCVEGNPAFLPLLRKNIARIGDHIELAACFVADRAKTVSLDRINTTEGGTASLSEGADAPSSVTDIIAKPLEKIVAEHPRFEEAKLLKIDTDGCDFMIIESSIDFLERTRPITFFEYTLDYRKTARADSLRAVDRLFESGFNHHLIYDNYGHFLIAADHPERFREINAFLTSNQKFGAVVHYVDVCSFHDDDIDLFGAIREAELDVGEASS